MNKLIKYALMSLIFFILYTLIFAFIGWDIRINEWDYIARIILILFWVITTGIYIGINEDKKNK